jgi:hypothetical protein
MEAFQSQSGRHVDIGLNLDRKIRTGVRLSGD